MNRLAFKRTAPRIIKYAPRILILLAIFAILLPLPINDDIGFWQSMAQDILYFGKWPYLQCWDHSFPGPLLIHVPVMFLLGRSDFAFRTADVLIQLSFCWMLYRLWKIWMSDRMAWLAALMYAIYYARSGPGVGGEKDVYGTILVFAASFLILQNRSSKVEIRNEELGREGFPVPNSSFLFPNLRLAGAGLLVGLAALIKPMNLIFLVPLMIWVPELHGVRPRAILLGFAIFPFLLSALIFALKPGGFDAYWTATILFNKDVYATISRPFHGFLKWLISPKVFAIPLVAGVIALLKGHRFRFVQKLARNERAIYISFVLLALAIVVMQRKYYSYHFVMFVVLLSPIAAHGIESVLDSSLVRRILGDALLPTRMASALLFAGLWILSLPYESLLQTFRHRTPSESISQTLHASFESSVWQNPSDDPTLHYFSQPARIRASVEVASFDPRLRFRLARPKEGKYPTLEALGYRTNQNDPHAFTNYQRVWRRAYIDSLRVLRPEYFIISRAPAAEYLRDPYSDVLHYIQGFDSLLQAAYTRDTIIGTNEIYRIKE